MGETYGTARHESRISKKRSAETARFLHHYERWCGHLDSAVLEQNMRMNLCERLAPVVRKAIEYGGGIHIFGGKGVSFIHAAFSELLECRSMLQHSYAFAFVNYRPNIFTRQQSNEKVVFERIQSELELLTEQISDVVARTHIRASETQINFLTKVTSGKRKEFTNFMIDVLRHSEIDKNKQLNSNQMNLPGHRPTNVRRSDYNTDDDEDLEAAAEAIRRSLDTYDAATNRHFHYNIDDNDIELHDWACTGCTYMNAGAVRRCDMCDTRR
jgi:Ariadne domain